jgi:hypothetical protein
MSFQNYMTAKSPYLMFPGLHGIQPCNFGNTKMQLICIPGITWHNSGITWLTTMSFQNHLNAKSLYLTFPGLHGLFLELHSIQQCNSKNTEMNIHVFLELHSVFLELHGWQPCDSKNYITAKSPFLMFPGLHGVFPELHGVQPCNYGNTKMNAHVFPESHGVFAELYGWQPCNSKIT